MAVLIATMWISVEAMAYSLLFIAVLSSFINAFPNKSLLGYSYKDQVVDIFPALMLSCVMGAAVYLIQFIGLGDILTLLIQVPLGAAVYIIGSKLLKLDSFGYVLSIFKSIIHKGSK